MTKKLTEQDLEVNRVYSAKRPRTYGFRRYLNDRQIIWLGKGIVQYDSISVKPGQNYPKVTIEQFLKWAKEDVTDLMPEEDWRTELRG